jgi:hypothetical protein
MEGLLKLIALIYFQREGEKCVQDHPFMLQLT